MEAQLAATAAPVPTRDDPTIWRVDDALWAELQPLLVIAKPRKKAGCHRHDDRPLLDGLIGLARTGAPWAAGSRERFGARATAHDRLQEWVAYGCPERAWARLLEVYDDDVALDRAWQAADGCRVKAPRGEEGGPVSRKRPGPTRPTGAHAARNGTS